MLYTENGATEEKKSNKLYFVMFCFSLEIINHFLCVSVGLITLLTRLTQVNNGFEHHWKIIMQSL